jgi:hypothetical protein
MASSQKIDFVLESGHGNRPFSVDARLQMTNKPKPVVVFVHGFKGFKDWGHFNLLADHFYPDQALPAEAEQVAHPSIDFLRKVLKDG